jgi:Domain of unknown function (DUF4136)
MTNLAPGLGHSTFVRVLIISLLSAITLCASDAYSDFDPDVNFSKFKTFSFIGGHELERSGILSNPATRERIKNFISGVMETRGLMEIPPDANPTLDVRYWVSVRQKEDVIDVTPPTMWGGFPTYWTGPWYYSYEEYVVQNYVDGTLIIDWIDPTTRELVWRTFLRQKIEDRTEAYEEAKKNLTKAFSVFPPSTEQAEKMRRERQKLEEKYK